MSRLAVGGGGKTRTLTLAGGVIERTSDISSKLEGFSVGYFYHLYNDTFITCGSGGQVKIIDVVTKETLINVSTGLSYPRVQSFNEEYLLILSNYNKLALYKVDYDKKQLMEVFNLSVTNLKSTYTLYKNVIVEIDRYPSFVKIRDYDMNVIHQFELLTDTTTDFYIDNIKEYRGVIVGIGGDFSKINCLVIDVENENVKAFFVPPTNPRVNYKDSIKNLIISNGTLYTLFDGSDKVTDEHRIRLLPRLIDGKVESSKIYPTMLRLEFQDLFKDMA